jgi:hypothetical protein
MNYDSVISKVQKLLALANSSNANEAAAAAAAANKLIDQYRLSEADFATSQADSDPLVEDDGFIYETGRIIPWKSSLVLTLAKHYGCAVFNSAHRPNGRQVSRYKLVGRTSDIHITKYMFNWLVLECQRLSELEAHGNGRIFVSSYCHGFVAGIRQQLVKSREEAKQNASEKSIIKIDAREQEAIDMMNKLHNLRASKNQSSSQIDHMAYSAGMNKGKSIHLGQSMSSGSKVKLLGNGN